VIDEFFALQVIIGQRALVFRTGIDLAEEPIAFDSSHSYLVGIGISGQLRQPRLLSGTGGLHERFFGVL
jgi:hypothetical protein